MADTPIADIVESARAASGKLNSLIAAFKTAQEKVEELLGNQMTEEIRAGLNAIFQIDQADAQAVDAALNTNP